MNNEQVNPFISFHQQQEAERAKFGLSDLSAPHAASVKMKAESYIRKENITDEDEKLKVYAETKQQYLVYLAYMKEKGYKP